MKRPVLHEAGEPVGGVQRCVVCGRALIDSTGEVACEQADGGVSTARFFPPGPVTQFGEHSVIELLVGAVPTRDRATRQVLEPELCLLLSDEFVEPPESLGDPEE